MPANWHDIMVFHSQILTQLSLEAVSRFWTEYFRYILPHEYYSLLLKPHRDESQFHINTLTLLAHRHPHTNTGIPVVVMTGVVSGYPLTFLANYAASFALAEERPFKAMDEIVFIVAEFKLYFCRFNAQGQRYVWKTYNDPLGDVDDIAALLLFLFNHTD